MVTGSETPVTYWKQIPSYPYNFFSILYHSDLSKENKETREGRKEDR